MIVAQERKLVVFCQNRRLIQRYREEIARTPDQAAPYFRLAQAAEATGDDVVALESLEAAVSRAKPAELFDGALLADAAVDHRYRLLMKMGEKARPTGALAVAEGHFRAAATSARQERDRLQARLTLADVQYDRGAVAESIKTLQELLGDETLRRLNVSAEGGRRSVRSDLLIADRLATIVGTKGLAVYEEYDREAAALLEAGRESGDARQFAEVARHYPASTVVPDALLELGRLQETGGHPAEAVRAYKRLLATSAGDLPRAHALLGMARAYEAQKLWVPARDAYTAVATRYASIALGGDGPDAKTPLGTLALNRLVRAPFDHMTGDRAEPLLPAPLSRLWSKPLATSWRPLSAEGVPPTAEAGRIFLTNGGDLRPIDANAAPPRWTAELGGHPLWVAYLDERVLAATGDRIEARRWRAATSSGSLTRTHRRRARRKPSPFDRPDAADGVKAENEPTGKLHGVRLVGNRIYALHGDRRLIGLDGETGQVDWSFTPLAGTINPNVLVTPETVVFQLRKPNIAVVLDAATGRRRLEFALTEDDDWERPPLAVDADHVAVVSNRRTVALLDLARHERLGFPRKRRDAAQRAAPTVWRRRKTDARPRRYGTDPARCDHRRETLVAPSGAENLSERPEAFALDGDQVYWVNSRNLNCASLRDGALAWTRYLSGPPSGWSIDLSARCVLAYPGQPRVGTEGEGFPLVFRRRSDGVLVQRLLFPPDATELTVRLAPGGLLVATENGVWSLGERSPVDVEAGGR